MFVCILNRRWDLILLTLVSLNSFNCGENWHDPVKCKVSLAFSFLNNVEHF